MAKMVILTGRFTPFEGKNWPNLTKFDHLGYLGLF